MNLPGILLYNLSGSKGFQIEKLAKKLHIEVRYVKETEHEWSIGVLFGLDPVVAVEGGRKIPEEMFVMGGFEDELLERFLKRYKEAGIAPVGLKAVLTEHNKDWKSVDLYHELTEEHAMFSKESKETS